jgi:hypothetical protein
MGIRGELFSTRFACDGRTYFFNVKQNRNGDVFLSIVESKPSEGESFDRRSIVVFGEHMEGFLKSFQSALKYIDKTGIKFSPETPAQPRDEERPRHERTSGYRGTAASARGEEHPRYERSSGNRETFASREGKAKRVVVRPASDRSRGEAFARPRNPVRRSDAAPRQDQGDPKPLKRIVVKRAKKADRPDSSESSN